MTTWRNVNMKKKEVKAKSWNEKRQEQHQRQNNLNSILFLCAFFCVCLFYIFFPSQMHVYMYEILLIIIVIHMKNHWKSFLSLLCVYDEDTARSSNEWTEEYNRLIKSFCATIFLFCTLFCWHVTASVDRK